MAEVVRRAAVLGSPIAHSLSPLLHRAAYDALDLTWSYEAVEVTSADLPGFVAGLGPEWVGLSLTMPLKTAVLPLLASRSATVELTGVANTVLLGAAGPVGDNTDVAGLAAAVREIPGRSCSAVTILGGGATARSAVVVAAELGARAVTVVVRRPDAVTDLPELGARVGVDLVVVPWSEAVAALGADLVLSTVPGTAADLLPSPPAPVGVLLDVVYDPWPSPLVTTWRRAGGAVVPGHVMLLHQAAAQVELMTGRPAPVAAMRAALTAAVPSLLEG